VAEGCVATNGLPALSMPRRFMWRRIRSNTQGSGALAALGPLTVVMLAAFIGTHQPGTLLSLYLLSGRVFYEMKRDARPLASRSARGRACTPPNIRILRSR
jgi:hypothetical protein